MPIPQEAIPVARQALPLSDMQHGLMGMTPPNPGMNNADDMGAMSKPYMNGQPQFAQQLAQQEMNQNFNTQAPQAAAAAQGQITAATAAMSEQEFRAQTLMNETAAQVLDAEGGGQYLQQINDVVQNGGREKLMNDLAVTKAMFGGDAGMMAGDGQYMAGQGQLDEYAANVNRYRPL